VLVVSADIGGGHHATGRALQERVQDLWPGSQVRWLDTLKAMGPGVGPAFRRIYITNVEVTPWLYEFFYTSLWRYPWFARAAKAFTGAWAGRRLAPLVEAFDPDLILSTYPLGSAGLAWLRRHRGLGVPVGAWVSDFAPHPFWVYPQLDLNLVVHPQAVPVANAAAPGARIAVCPPPVLMGFRPGDRDEARRRFGLDASRYVVVVACGTFGFGAVEEAVRGLTGLGGPVQVVVVCGHNQRLADRLAGLGEPAQPPVVLGWVDDMPALLRAADLLVTNAGGATALEAWATGTPMVMYRPIAAHGAANAALMTACGLTETYQNLPDLVHRVRSMLSAAPIRPDPKPDGACLSELGLSALAATDPGLPDTGARPTLRSWITGGAGRSRSIPSWPLRAQDAFFLHVQSATVAQQIGAVLELDPLPSGRPVSRNDVVELLTQRLPAIITLRRRLLNRGRLRRPGWIIAAQVDAAAHVEEHRLAVGAGESDGDAAIDRFWSLPLPLHQPPWRMLLVTGLPEGRTRLAIKLHHSLGDGLSVIGTLQRLLDPAPGRRPGPATDASPQPRPEPHQRAFAAARAGVQRALITARGLVRLAAAGRAPRVAFNQPLTTPRRTLVTATLPAAVVRQVARECGVHASELMCALTADALRRTYPHMPALPRMRAMFAVSLDPRGRSRTQGNWTGAIALDLPLEPLTPRARVVAVRDRLRGSLANGQPAAAALVMRAMGSLPAPAHAALARLVYNSRFVNVIVSYMSGSAHPQLLAGAPVRSVAPVVALATDVPIGIGVLRWGDTTTVGVLLDESLADTGNEFVSALRAALAEVVDDVPNYSHDSTTA
jgi:WS/DGAT/MGAT family acyltransferase